MKTIFALFVLCSVGLSCKSSDEVREANLMMAAPNGCHYVLVCADMGVPDMTYVAPVCRAGTQQITYCHSYTNDGRPCGQCIHDQSCNLTASDAGAAIYCTQSAINCYDPLCQYGD